MCFCLNRAIQSTGPPRLWAASIAPKLQVVPPVRQFRRAPRLRQLRRLAHQAQVRTVLAAPGDDCRARVVLDAGCDRVSAAAEFPHYCWLHPWAAIPGAPTPRVELQTPAAGPGPSRPSRDPEIWAARVRGLPADPAYRLAFRLVVCAACCDRVSIFACCSCNTAS